MLTRVVLVALAVSMAAASCNVTAALCDNTWSSRMNQTFAYQGTGFFTVQLDAYYGNDHSCLSVMGNASQPVLSNAGCNTNASLWTYGPNIKTYVWFMHINTKRCLTLNVTNASTSLTVQPCCHRRSVKCTPTQYKQQMWLEPPTTSNPYDRILSLYTGNSTAGYCLTKVGNAVC